MSEEESKRHMDHFRAMAFVGPEDHPRKNGVKPPDLTINGSGRNTILPLFMYGRVNRLKPDDGADESFTTEAK